MRGDTAVCLYCNQKFIKVRNEQKFCPKSECRTKYHNERKARAMKLLEQEEKGSCQERTQS